jgi:hypothetical protein
MTMTKELSTSAEVIAACLCSVGGDILKTDVLGRITVGSAQREAILDAFEASGMTGHVKKGLLKRDSPEWHGIKRFFV